MKFTTENLFISEADRAAASSSNTDGDYQAIRWSRDLFLAIGFTADEIELAETWEAYVRRDLCGLYYDPYRDIIFLTVDENIIYTMWSCQRFHEYVRQQIKPDEIKYPPMYYGNPFKTYQADETHIIDGEQLACRNVSKMLNKTRLPADIQNNLFALIHDLSWKKKYLLYVPETESFIIVTADGHCLHTEKYAQMVKKLVYTMGVNKYIEALDNPDAAETTVKIPAGNIESGEEARRLPEPGMSKGDYLFGM